MPLNASDKTFLLAKIRAALAAGVAACDVAIANGEGFKRAIPKSRFGIMYVVLKGIREELKLGAGLEAVDAAIVDLLITLEAAGKRA